MNNAALKYKYREESYELINGKEVMLAAMPSVNHNRVVSNVSRIFQNYLRGKRCEAFSDGVEVHLDDENVFVPDAMIVCDKNIIKSDGIYGAPDLVAEVLSPSTARYDRNAKMKIYERYGVKEYWIINPPDKTVEVYKLVDGRFEFDNIYAVFADREWEGMSEERRAAESLPLKVSLYDDFEIDVKDIFERVPFPWE